MPQKPLAVLTLLACLAAPVHAQDWQMPQADDPPAAGTDDPLGDLGQDLGDELDGAMNQLFNRLQPHLNALGDELANTMNDFAPALNEISGLIDDIRNYERPERLDNGDIIIRRRADAPPPPSLDELQRLLPERDGSRPEGQWPPLDPWSRPDKNDLEGTIVPQTEL
ncbi:hypothetical protein [Paracoccus albus]|uniref:hypothetical protein n=1 Tax=Paracoccus albus TaxID=3017784 RepID=UPI0022EFF00E|nr:hypothetical protein [Paracoccus albus]WBU58903.1 hypothetical protein PAF20_08710 [Paracoccus albus]